MSKNARQFFGVSKRMLCLILFMTLNIALVYGAEEQAPAAGSVEHWASVYMNKLVEQGVIKGDEYGELLPDNAIGRAEFAQIGVNLFEYNDYSQIEYEDVLQGDWYYGCISRGTAQGFISGFENRVEPLGRVYREDAAVMAARMLKMEENFDVSTFPDAENISDYAKGYVGALSKAGYLKGDEEGKFNPRDAMTRAEACVLLSKIAGKVYKEANTYDLNNQEVHENITIASQGIILKNANINGNLYITEGVGVEGAVIENVTVKGKTIISAKEGASISLDGEFYQLQIFSPKIKIMGKGNIQTAEIYAQGVTTEMKPKTVLMKEAIGKEKLNYGYICVDANTKFPTSVNLVFNEDVKLMKDGEVVDGNGILAPPFKYTMAGETGVIDSLVIRDARTISFVFNKDVSAGLIRIFASEENQEQGYSIKSVGRDSTKLLNGEIATFSLTEEQLNWGIDIDDKTVKVGTKTDIWPTHINVADHDKKNFNYKWYKDNVLIPEATGSTYELKSEKVIKHSIEVVAIRSFLNSQIKVSKSVFGIEINVVK